MAVHASNALPGAALMEYRRIREPSAEFAEAVEL